MNVTRALLRAVSIFFFLLLVSSPAQAAWPHDPQTCGIAVCTDPTGQSAPQMVTDGAGGIIVTWVDGRGIGDIYAQRIAPDGRRLWASGGVVICGANLNQGHQRMIADGAGGAFVVWQDPRSTAGMQIYAQRIDASGRCLWTRDGILVCAQRSDEPEITSDGAGGAIICWQDARNAVTGAYAQRVNASGELLWSPDGVQVADASAWDGAKVVGDGAGGAYVGWVGIRDGNQPWGVYIRRISSEGNILWSGTPGKWSFPASLVHMVSDDAGGVFLTWFTWPYDISIQHFTPGRSYPWWDDEVQIRSNRVVQSLVAAGNGAVLVFYRPDLTGPFVVAQKIGPSGDLSWGADGIPLTDTTGDQPAAATDGEDGAFVAWVDGRSGSNIYAQHLKYDGVAQWAPGGIALSAGDATKDSPVMTADGAGGAYVAWRNETLGVRVQHIDRFAEVGAEPFGLRVRDVPDDQGGRINVTWSASPLESDSPGLVQEYRVWRRLAGDWQLVGNIPAAHSAGYVWPDSTATDSAAAGNPYSAFRVEAYASATAAWFSDPDSGYSVDNLAPAVPTGFLREPSGGGTLLHWNRNPEPDLAGYRLYRGSDPSFVPGSATLLTAVSDSAYLDPGVLVLYYKLSAVDRHGNESAWAEPLGYTAVMPSTSPRVELALASSNPSRSRARFRLSLPRSLDAQVVVYDVAGREMAELARGSHPAGAYVLEWDGRDASGRPAAGGMYVARLVAGGEVRATRFMMLR